MFRTTHFEEKVKVAVVFEADRIRPVWFEMLGRERVQVREVCGIWYHAEGSARIMNFDLWDPETRQKYQLVYNTQDISWRVALTVVE